MQYVKFYLVVFTIFDCLSAHLENSKKTKTHHIRVAATGFKPATTYFVNKLSTIYAKLAYG